MCEKKMCETESSFLKECKNCRYYKSIDDVKGECRINPPEIIMRTPSSTSTGICFGFWPVVESTDWCGDIDCSYFFLGCMKLTEDMNEHMGDAMLEECEIDYEAGECSEDAAKHNSIHLAAINGGELTNGLKNKN